MFHCSLGTRAVSLCAAMEGPRIASLAFHYGVPDDIRLSYLADDTNGQRFYATVGTLMPRATVRQLWFTLDGDTYLLSECVGGACPEAARLSVLRGQEIVSNERCMRSADDRAWFPRALIHFGNAASASVSKSGFLVIDDVDHGIERLYATPR
jgi:hypothetical protein